LPDEERYGLTSKAYLVNALGDQGIRIDVANTIDIDARPPGAPGSVTTEALNNKIKLDWPTNSEKDLKGYQIWASASPISGYHQTGFSEKNTNVLDGLPNFDPIYIKVRAVDQADNHGPFSQQVAAIPLPEPGLHDLPQPSALMDGDIETSILLVREKSPYDIASDLRILPGATLYTEPNVELHFAPNTALIVDGGSFVAYGEKERPVRLVPNAGEAALPGTWKGLVIRQAPRVRLRHVTLTGAATGVTVIDSSPEIYAATISKCSQAGLYLKSNARPDITCTRFVSNGGQGAIVIEGQGVSPKIRQSTFIQNEPFQVQSYAPMVIDLRENYWGVPDPSPESFLGDIQWEPALSAPPDMCGDR